MHPGKPRMLASQQAWLTERSQLPKQIVRRASLGAEPKTPEWEEEEADGLKRAGNERGTRGRWTGRGGRQWGNQARREEELWGKGQRKVEGRQRGMRGIQTTKEEGQKGDGQGKQDLRNEGKEGRRTAVQTTKSKVKKGNGQWNEELGDWVAVLQGPLAGHRHHHGHQGRVVDDARNCHHGKTELRAGAMLVRVKLNWIRML